MALPPEARRPKPKPKAKKKAYTLPKTSKPEATTRTAKPKAGPPTPAPRRPAPKVQPGPMPDRERKAVAKHKRTPTYLAAVKVAYRSQPLAARQQRVSEILNKLSGPRKASGRDNIGRLSIEDVAVLDTHMRRSRRDDKLLGSKQFTDRQRKLVESFRGTEAYRAALLEAKYPIRTELQRRNAELFETDRAKLKKVGFDEPGVLDAIATSPALVVGGALTSAGALAKAAYKDPVGVPAKTAKSLPTAVAAMPAAAIGAVLHPAKAAGEIAESLGTPYDEKVRRIRKGGALEDIGNAAILAPSVGGVSRLALRGKTRAVKLDSGGTGRRPRTNGPTRYIVGSKIDNAKAKRYERLVAKGKPLSALQHEALQRNRAAGRVVAVVPLRSKAKIRREGVAKPRGKGVAALRYLRAKGPVGRLAKTKFDLKPAERAALWAAMEVGIRTPEAARVHLPKLIEKMESTRTAEPRGRERKMDVIAELRTLLDAPEKHFTPNLRKVLSEIAQHTDDITAIEPQFRELTKEGRRRAVQAYLLDLTPGELEAPTPDQVTLYHASTAGPDEILKSGLQPRKPIDTDLDEPAGVYLTADPKVARSYGRHIYTVKADAGKLLDDPSLNGVAKYTSDAIEPSSIKYVGQAGIRHAEAGLWDDTLIDSLPKLGKPHVSAKLAPDLNYTPETPAEFHARIDAAAAEAGLARPMYFKSEKQRGLQADYSAAVAGGDKTKSTGKAYEGKNLGEGIFDTSFEQMLRGYEHNQKARVNYDLVIDLDRRNRLQSIIPEPQGVTVGTALNRINRADPELQPESVALVNLGLFQKNMDHEPGSDLDVPDAEDAFDSSLANALAKSTITDFNQKVDPELAQTPGWQAWPKEALRELEAELKAGSAGGRAFDIVKGKLSQAILLTGNLPWLAIQFASEGAVTAAASKGRAFTPSNIAGTVKMWQSLSDRERGEVAGAMGLGSSAADTITPKMGSSIHSGFGHTWRMFKAADFWHKPRVAGQPVATLINPTKWMRAADVGKSNVYRLLYANQELAKNLSKEKVEALGDALTGMAKAAPAIDKALPILKQPPTPERTKYLMEHLDDVSDSVSNALGDWTTLTASERMWANRFVMFYPFVRYSTRLLTYTMPVDHPAITALLAELAQLRVEEYREVFGDDDLPWHLGKIYFGETGASTGIDLARANPLLNAAVSGLARAGTDSANVPGAALGMLPPYFQWAAQHAGWNTFKGKPTKFDSDTSPFPKKPSEVSAAEHGKLFVAELQSLMYPAREAMQRLHPGAQSDASSLLFPTPLKYKPSSHYDGEGLGDEISRRKARLAEDEQAHRKENEGGVLDAAFGPLVPKPSRDKASSKERAYIKKLEAEQERRRKAPGRHSDKKSKGPFKSAGGKKSPFKGR